MKKQYFIFILSVTIFFIFFLFNSFYLPGIKKSETKLQQAKLPVPMILPQIVHGKGKYYILNQGNSDGFRKRFGIVDSAFVSDNQVIIYEFLPSNGIVKKLADADFSRSFFAACIEENKIYIGGGYDKNWNPTSTLFEYDIASKNWKKKKSMFFERARFALECSDGKIYAIGGENTNGSIEIYDPQKNHWKNYTAKYIPENLHPMQTISSSAVIDNRIYILGSLSSIFQIFTPSENIQTEGPAAPFKSDFFSIAAYSNKLYVGSGLVGDSIDENIYLFNNIQGNWSKAGKIPIPRYGSGMVFHENMLFFLGGSLTGISEHSRPIDAIYIYRPMR